MSGPKGNHQGKHTVDFSLIWIERTGTVHFQEMGVPGTISLYI